MNRLRRFYSAAPGKKIVMGVTGLIGIGFVLLHMAGNLLAFRGAEELNAYAHFLASTGEVLWLLRTVLVVAVILHVIAAYQLTMQNRAARPIGYVNREPQVSTCAPPNDLLARSPPYSRANGTPCATHWSMMFTLISASRYTFASRARKSPPFTVS